MIVSMKKIHIIVQDHHRVTALEKLREFGAVHVEHGSLDKDTTLATLQEDIKNLQDVLFVLKEHHNKNISPEPAIDWKTTVRAIQKLMIVHNDLREDVHRLMARIETWEPWGDFSPYDIEKLESQGVFVKLFTAPPKEWTKFKVPDGMVCEVIQQAKPLKVMAVSLNDFECPFQEVTHPNDSLKQMRFNCEEDKKRLIQISDDIAAYAKHYEALLAIYDELLEDLDFQKARAGMDQDGPIAVLRGFCPFDRTDELEKYANEMAWGVAITEPDPDDAVPTCVRNPKWVEIVQPVFNMINIFPEYKEVDMSPPFVLFFTLFFGMLIGDAGYGLIFIVLTLAIQMSQKSKNYDRNPFYLMYVLSGFTLIWGILTGTWFGSSLIQGAFFEPKLPWLNESRNIQWLCFLIGAIHLSLAHIWQAVIKFPKWEFVSEVGWLVMIWVMFFACNIFVLADPVPGFIGPLLILSLILILGPWVPAKKFDPLLPLQVINCFTDVVSYIRLFAVGMATVAVADAANAMGGVGMIMLHLLNIVLAAMAILVHGLRLNVLEFSGHLGLEWAGVKYSPLSKKASLQR